MADFFLFQCPECGLDIQVMANEINCTIFRHGVLKDSGQQISPHEPQSSCEALVKADRIWGCGKPFRFSGGLAEKCGYI